MDSPQPDYYATSTTATASSSQPAATTSSSVITPLLISFAGVTITLLLLIAYHLLIAKFCLRRTSTVGVEERVLNSIPVLPYSKKDNNNNNGGGNAAELSSDDCVICIGELEEGETVRFLPSCGHVFHASCVDHWFSAHSSCPTCRAPVIPPPPSADVVKSRGARNAGAAAGGGLGVAGDSSYNSCLEGEGGAGSRLREGQPACSFVGLKRSRSADELGR